MPFDIEMLKTHYANFSRKVAEIRKNLGKPLTLTEKILYTHLHPESSLKEYKRSKDYVFFAPDRVAMQDATAQMALLQFMTCGKSRTSVPTTVHCDHLILAEHGASNDLATSNIVNEEVFKFLESISNKYGIGFWKPGSGIIHQIVLENYAFPGGMMIGTDSHTPNAGGLGMIAIGVGGADAVDVMSGMPWELKMPKLIGIHLKGKLSGWTSSKDVILKVAGILTVKGGTGAIVEYFGEGARSLSCTGKGTICNMGAEIGATTSTFGYDESMGRYLRSTGRKEVADLCDLIATELTGDAACYENPENYFDQVIEIDLNILEPHINGPYTPDLAWPLSEFAKAVRENNYPEKLDVGLIGSCTNSSYEDLSRAASLAQQAVSKKLKVKSEYTVTPGSELIRYTVERDAILEQFEKMGGVILANACGPCIGQWKRHMDDPNRKNSIITSFNRNFSKRNDGNSSTHAFVASPEIVTALAIAGSLTFNPITDYLTNEEGQLVKLDPPIGVELPVFGFEVKDAGFQAPASDGQNVQIVVNPTSKRLQLLAPFEPILESELKEMRILIKAKGKCTTDHISMAGPWLEFRGHLENISNNCFIGALNAYNGESNRVLNLTNNEYMAVPDSARLYKKENIGTVVFGEENYGEGSSREHAAMEPRYLGVKAVIVKSFARIHETNLKKQGMLALTFLNPQDYDKIRQDDLVEIQGLQNMTPTSTFTVILKHSDHTQENFEVIHTYNQQQIQWVQEGSALNKIRRELSAS
ncbi:MAG: aconitate hydratase [Saprospiraceae bacterium]|nr:aconitate hydratase [Saprospiraceae bacterium]